MNSQSTPKTKVMQRGLVYGTLLGAVALLTFHSAPPARDGQIPQPGDAPTVSATGNDAGIKTANGFYYTGPMQRRRSAQQDAPPNAAAQWHEGVPALSKPIQISVSNAPLSAAISRIAALTGLNLVCFDAQGQSRVSLTVSHLPAWQAMQALADASGGHWERHAQIYTLRSGKDQTQTVADAGSPPRRHPGLAIAE